MSKKNARFTGEKIASAGFVELSPGVYGKRDAGSEANNTKPQTNKLERTVEEGLRARVGSKKAEKEQIAQATTTSYWSSPSGLDPSTHLTDVQNILKTLSS